MNELLGKVIKSINHGFDSNYEHIVTIETENEFFHYKIVETHKKLEFISKTGIGVLPEHLSRLTSGNICNTCSLIENKDVIKEYGICRKCISDNLRSWELGK